MFSLSLFRSSLLLLPTDVSDCGSCGAQEVKGYGPLRGPQEILREWDVVGVGVGRWVGLRRLQVAENEKQKLYMNFDATQGRVTLALCLLFLCNYG